MPIQEAQMSITAKLFGMLLHTEQYFVTMDVKYAYTYVRVHE